MISILNALILPFDYMVGWLLECLPGFKFYHFLRVKTDLFDIPFYSCLDVFALNKDVISWYIPMNKKYDVAIYL